MKAAWVALVCALFAMALTVASGAPALAATPRWKPIQAPGSVRDSTGYHLDAVDCWTPGNCVAVGYRSSDGTSGSVIDKETDGTWSYVATTASGLELTSVSCPAAGACVAAGTLDTSPAEGELEVQSGSTWTEITATGVGGL